MNFSKKESKDASARDRSDADALYGICLSQMYASGIISSQFKAQIPYVIYTKNGYQLRYRDVSETAIDLVVKKLRAVFHTCKIQRIEEAGTPSWFLATYIRIDPALSSGCVHLLSRL